MVYSNNTKVVRGDIMTDDFIRIKGLKENNLKDISFEIPKNKITVFTGLSGSGKSSIVFDTIAAESQRQMNETYPSFIRSRLPKYEKPKVDSIENLSMSVIVDQTRITGNKRSTVGTITDMYSLLRLLFSRIGKPYVGPSSVFSFNDPMGMCPKCSGIGKVIMLDIESKIDENKTWNEGMADLPAFRLGNWYYKKYKESNLFPVDKKYKDFTEVEKSRLLYGSDYKGGKQLDKNVEGIYNYLYKMSLKRDLSELTESQQERMSDLLKEVECPKCHGKKLNRMALISKINGYTITDLSKMEFISLKKVLSNIIEPKVKTIVDSLILTLNRMIDIGLQYLSMDRESSTLSGGEAQRLKLVRYMGSSLTGITYIFDEPTTGMHSRDVYRMSKLLKSLRDKGNTVLVVEHDKDIISIADNIIDVGPLQGKNGGEIVFNGTYHDLLLSDTITGKALNQNTNIKEKTRVPKEFLSLKNININNLKNVSVDIPLNIMTVVTGVAGSGKSSLIRDAFSKQYSDRVILVDQSPITATNRSTPASYLGIFDDIRNLYGKANNVNDSLFSFNSDGACPVCNGKGYIYTELAFMEPVTTLCEACEGKRFSKKTLQYFYKEKNIVQALEMTVKEAREFFDGNKRITKSLDSLIDVGLSYMTLGQPSSTMSGGEQQRLKLAKYLDKKGNIYVLDEPTTGLHISDTENIMKLFNRIVDKGNTVIIIEHNMDVIKNADYIIDIGPDGGRFGGQVIFTGTPKEMIETSNTLTAKFLKYSINNNVPSEEELEDLIRVNEEDIDVPLVKKEDNDVKEDDKMKLNEIGHAICSYKEYKIELDDKYIEGLKGLDGYSHIQVVFWFNGCDDDENRNILNIKKPYTKGPDEVGTFASRSPERPNPIGISTCKIEKIDYEKANYKQIK